MKSIETVHNRALIFSIKEIISNQLRLDKIWSSVISQ
jgi:hypothetical protein